MSGLYEPDVFEGVDLDDLPGSLAAGPCNDTCDWCKAPARWADGKFGVFIACSKYPKCKWTASKTRKDLAGEVTAQEPTA